MFLIFINFGSLDFGQVFSKAAAMPADQGAGIFTVICLLLFLGATGKSAQIPLMSGCRMRWPARRRFPR